MPSIFPIWFRFFLIRRHPWSAPRDRDREWIWGFRSVCLSKPHRSSSNGEQPGNATVVAAAAVRSCRRRRLRPDVAVAVGGGVDVRGQVVGGVQLDHSGVLAAAMSQMGKGGIAALLYAIDTRLKLLDSQEIGFMGVNAAANHIRRGEADVMFAGGAVNYEAICFTYFLHMHLLPCN